MALATLTDGKFTMAKSTPAVSQSDGSMCQVARGDEKGEGERKGLITSHDMHDLAG